MLYPLIALKQIFLFIFKVFRVFSEKGEHLIAAPFIIRQSQYNKPLTPPLNPPLAENLFILPHQKQFPQ